MIRSGGGRQEFRGAGGGRDALVPERHGGGDDDAAVRNDVEVRGLVAEDDTRKRRAFLKAVPGPFGAFDPEV